MEDPGTVDSLIVMILVGGCAILAAWMGYCSWKKAEVKSCGSGKCGCRAKIQPHIVKKG